MVIDFLTCDERFNVMTKPEHRQRHTRYARWIIQEARSDCRASLRPVSAPQSGYPDASFDDRLTRSTRGFRNVSSAMGPRGVARSPSLAMRHLPLDPMCDRIDPSTGNCPISCSTRPVVAMPDKTSEAAEAGKCPESPPRPKPFT